MRYVLLVYVYTLKIAVHVQIMWQVVQILCMYIDTCVMHATTH